MEIIHKSMAKKLYKGLKTNMKSLIHKSPRCQERTSATVLNGAEYIFSLCLRNKHSVYNIVHFVLFWSSVFVRGRIAC